MNATRINYTTPFPSPFSREVSPQLLISHVPAYPSRNGISHLLCQNTSFINLDLLGREPNLDTKLLNISRENRARAVGPLRQRHVLVSTIPQDSI